MSSTRFVGAALAAVVAFGCGSRDDDTGSGGTTFAGSGGGGASAGSGGGTSGSGGSIAGPLALAPGEVAELDLQDGATGTRLAAPNGDEKFIVVLASTKLVNSSATYAYSLSPAAPAEDANATVVEGCSISSGPWSTMELPAETPPSGVGPNVGDQRSFSIGASTGTEVIQAEAIAVGAVAAVWADVTPAHPAVIDPAAVQEFLTDFENIILPRARTVFGMESDIDGDGHIGLVFTPLTYDTAVAFFTSCDLDPGLGCPAGNDGEYLYLTPPNAIDPPYNTPAAIKEILAHELSHMIHYNRKVLRNSLAAWTESAYMIEGIGALSQDVLGYQAGNLYVTMAGLDGIDKMSLGKTIANGASYAANDGILRGGSYLFVRYFYDRAGGDVAKTDKTIQSTGGPALLRTLLDDETSIADALPVATGAPIADIAIDYWTALATSNRDVVGDAAPMNPCFSYLPTALDPITGKQRGANLFASFHQQQMNGPKLQTAADADGTLLSGGAELIELDATSGVDKLGWSLTVDPAANPRVRVARIR